MGRLRILAWPDRAGDQGNPFLDLLYAPMRDDPTVQVVAYTNRRLAFERWDIVHVHWPEWAVGAGRIGGWEDLVQFNALLLGARLRGARVVWTAHNLRPHERSGAIDHLMGAFVHQIDLVIGLSQDSLDQAAELYPLLAKVPKVVVPLGHYRSVYPTSVPDRQAARQQLGFDRDGRTLLLIGQLRPYKNVDGLIRCFRAVASPNDRLVIAGRPISEEMRRLVTTAADGDGRIVLRLQHVPDEEVALLLQASDLVVLPYREVTNSAAALLALSFDRPVVAPAAGSLPELAAAMGGEWVRTYSGDFDEAVLEEALRAPIAAGSPNLRSLDWGPLSAQTVGAYRAARHRRRTATLRPRPTPASRGR